MKRPMVYYWKEREDEGWGHIWALTTAPRSLFMLLSLKFGLVAAMSSGMTLWIVAEECGEGTANPMLPKASASMRVPGISAALAPLSHLPAGIYSECPAQMKQLHFRANQAAIGPAKRAATHHVAAEAASGGCAIG
jgi:hypothetical protein